jgi:hypothetical protein
VWHTNRSAPKAVNSNEGLCYQSSSTHPHACIMEPSWRDWWYYWLFWIWVASPRWTDGLGFLTILGSVPAQMCYDINCEKATSDTMCTVKSVRSRHDFLDGSTTLVMIYFIRRHLLPPWYLDCEVHRCSRTSLNSNPLISNDNFPGKIIQNYLG